MMMKLNSEIAKTITSKKEVIFGMVGLNLMVSICALLINATSTTTIEKVVTPSSGQEIQLLSSNLTEVQKSIADIKFEINKPRKTMNISHLEKNINHLSEAVSKINHENEMKLKALINHNNHELNRKLGVIEDKVQRITPKADKTYLSTDKLPFVVLAIDSIQEVPVLDASYANKNVALEEGDVLAGWEVKKVSYQNQAVVFENKNHELIKINLLRG